MTFAPEFKCFRCTQTSPAAAWDAFTQERFGKDCKPINEGYQNRNWMYVCPSCGELCYAPDIEEHWPDIGLDFYGRNE
jgi:hypothetical protein